MRIAKVQVFKNKPFARFARKCEISDIELCTSIESASRGLIDSDLGGSVIKQRIARRGEGKSGGFRTLILFRAGDRAIFVHGFAKNEVANIRQDELIALKKLALTMLAYDAGALAAAVASGTLTEVKCDANNETIP